MEATENQRKKLLIKTETETEDHEQTDNEVSDDELCESEVEDDEVCESEEDEDDKPSKKKKEKKPKIKLELAKRETAFLDTIEMCEVVPIQRIKALIKSGVLKENWGNDNDPHSFMVRQKYDNEIEQLTQYLKNYKLNEGGVSVKYLRPKHKWGRPFPANSLGLTSMRRKIRNTLITELYKDFDLKSAQPNIIVTLCKADKIVCDKIEDFCLHKDEWFKKIMKIYGVNKAQAKNLLLRLCFFGTFKGWLKEEKVVKENKPTQRIKDFEEQMFAIGESFKKKNKDLYEVARKKKEDNPLTFDGRDRALGSMVGLYLQEWEYIVVGEIMKHLHEETDLFKNPNNPESKYLCGTYEYDGIKLLIENVERFETEKGVSVVDYLNKITEELTGMKLEWADKEIEEPYDISEFIEIQEEDDKPDDLLIAWGEGLLTHIRNRDKGVCDLIKQSPFGKFYLYLKGNKEKSGDWICWCDKRNRWVRGDCVFRQDLSGKITDWIWEQFTAFKYYETPEDLSFEAQQLLSVNEKYYKKMRAEVKDAILFSLSRHDGNNAVIGKAKGEFLSQKDFDKNENLFGCDNGVFDIEKGLFRSYKYDDFVSLSSGKPTGEEEEPDHFRPFMKGLKTEVKIDLSVMTEMINNTTQERIGYREPTADEIKQVEKGFLYHTIPAEAELKDIEAIITIIMDDEGNIIKAQTRMPTEDERHMFNVNGEICMCRDTTDDDMTAHDKQMLKDIEDLMAKIMPKKEERDYLWRILGSGVSGKAIEKFFIYNGGGRNGKGLIDEFMLYCLGDYACEMNVSVLTEDPNKAGSGGANAEKAKISKMRYVFCAEPKKGVKLNNATIKKITGGGVLSARACYSNDCEVWLNLTLILECNDRPLFAEEPTDADRERINDIKFGSRFTDQKEEWTVEHEKQNVFKQNTLFKETKWKKEHKNAFLNMLFVEVLKLKADAYNVDLIKPQSIKERSLEYLNKSSDIFSIFKTLFEKRDENRTKYYYDCNGEQKCGDEDWSVAKAVKEITQTKDYEDLIRDKGKKSEYGTAKLIKEWVMKKGSPINPYIAEDKNNHTAKIVGWRHFREPEDED
tara:strand:- start:1552 stop:4782 length:3231 start_codon:yes stop_codon:yes gene_type:complete